MPNCFIIMPITTPDDALPLYKDDVNHFSHVLKYLLTPAVEAAGFTPIPPAAQGADLIQAGIVENLETADLVLCDMSCLNPNVFFELGIRTALDKPVCMIRDEVSGRVPFDTSIINYHTYDSSLTPWSLRGEIPSLTEHIKNSGRTEKNMLWKYFGITTRAHAPDASDSPDSTNNYLALQVEALRRQINGLTAAQEDTSVCSVSFSFRERRKRLGLSQMELANIAGVSNSIISNIEDDRVVASVRSIDGLNRILNKLEQE